MYLRIVLSLKSPPIFLSPVRGLCRSRASQLEVCSNIYLTSYNIFTRAAAFCGRFYVASQKVHKCRIFDMLHKKGN